MTSTHGSHSSNNTGSHSNSSNSANAPASLVQAHSVSWGTTLRTTVHSNSITDPVNLALFTRVINDIRYSMGSTAISEITSESALQTAVSNLSNLSKPKYQWGRLEVSGHGDTNKGHNSHGNSHESNDSSDAIQNVFAHSSSTNKPNLTVYYRSTNLQDVINVSPGSITYSSDPSTLLSRLNAKMLQSSYLPTFGTSTRSFYNHSSHADTHSNCKEEVKENIKDLKMNAVDLINQINLVSFNYKKDTEYDPSIQHYGFLANNTDEAFATQYHDRMDYTNCIGILLKAVQELSVKIDKLENR